MTDKEKYVNKIMDAVGEIDEKYVYEAQNYTPKKRIPAYIIAPIAAAACFLLIIGLSFPVAVSVLIRRGNSKTGPDLSEDISLAQRFEEASVYRYETLPDIDGAALVWYTQESGYSYIPISETKAVNVISCIGKDSKPAEEDDELSIWIKTEKGEFISPELKKTPGNVGCAVFRYMPEITVSDSASSLIEGILKERNNKT